MDWKQGFREQVERVRERAAAAGRALLRRDTWAAIRERRWTSYALVLAGVALLVYVGTQYGTMYLEQRRLARAWEEQQNAAPGATTTIVDDGLVRVTIPKIELDAIVVDGTTPKKLLIGPGRLEGTAAPGENGNSVITAHRDTFFRHIYQLNQGDEIIVRRRGEVFRFEVTGKRVVKPTATYVTRPTEDAQLTLITCYPTYYVGPAPERLVVFSKLVERMPDNARASSATPATPVPAEAPLAPAGSH